MFNVVIANDDCHLKNLSFFMAPDGIKLAQHYDLLATSAYYTRAFADDKARWANVQMAIALPDAKVFAEVTSESVLQAGLDLGVPLGAAQRILKNVATGVAAALKKEVEDLSKRHTVAPPGARVHLAAEVRLLSVLENIIVPEMLKRLGN